MVLKISSCPAICWNASKKELVEDREAWIDECYLSPAPTIEDEAANGGATASLIMEIRTILNGHGGN